LHISTNFSTPKPVNHTSRRCAGKIGPYNAPDVRATTSVLGGRINQPGLKRDRWKEKDGKRTFNDLMGTL
jgi:hypothetical protein